MKKIITLILTAALLFSLCSCGLSEEAFDKVVEGEISLENADKDTEQNADEAPAQDTESSTEEAFELGKTQGGVYTNKYFGFKCTLDSSWTFMSDDEILEMNNLAKDMVGDELTERIENASILYEMYAQTENGDSVNINIENAGAAALLLTEKDYIEAQTDILKEGLENEGFTDVEVSVTDVDFAGSSHSAMKVDSMINGVPFEELIITVKKGARFANISLSSLFGSIDTILDCFSPLEP